MNGPVVNGQPNEAELVKLYTQLTGLPESTARSVFMYVGLPDDERGQDQPRTSVADSAQPHPARTSTSTSAALLVLACACWAGLARAESAAGSNETSGRLLVAQTNATHRSGNAAASKTPSSKSSSAVASNTVPLFSQPLSLADAINLALHRNADVLRAQKDVEATQGIIMETRAIALPTVGIDGSYSAVQKTDVDMFETPSFIPGMPGFSFGTPQNWSSQIKLVQSVYQGGRILSALRASRLMRDASLLNYQTTLADTVLDVQLAYYAVLLAAEQITVQEASVELLTQELADNRRRFDAGTVPRFNVLRAEVEVANARPKLIQARNYLRITKNNLVNKMGYDVPHETLEDIPLTLSGSLKAEPYNVELSRAIGLALEQRTELGALRKTEALRREDLVNAKAGYKPVLQGFVGYDAHNSILSQDLTDERHGWIAGAQLSWNIFDGLRTQGRIREATANYERAGVDVEDKTRRIELEVRTDYSVFIEAREVLESQTKAVEEAEEALRLARARNEAGTGTQLDVLSAQTALTDARSTLARALHDYAAARARLQRAIGNNIPTEPAH